MWRAELCKVIIFLLMIGVCVYIFLGPEGAESENSNILVDEFAFGLWRVVDTELNVVCYTRSEAMFCIKFSETVDLRPKVRQYVPYGRGEFE